MIIEKSFLIFSILFIAKVSSVAVDVQKVDKIDLNIEAVRENVEEVNVDVENVKDNFEELNERVDEKNAMDNSQTLNGDQDDEVQSILIENDGSENNVEVAIADKDDIIPEEDEEKTSYDGYRLLNIFPKTKKHLEKLRYLSKNGMLGIINLTINLLGCKL